jgi:hypothetical protein
MTFLWDTQIFTKDEVKDRMPVAMRFEAQAYSLLICWIAGLNPSENMDVRFLCKLCFV